MSRIPNKKTDHRNTFINIFEEEAAKLEAAAEEEAEAPEQEKKGGVVTPGDAIPRCDRECQFQGAECDDQDTS